MVPLISFQLDDYLDLKKTIEGVFENPLAKLSFTNKVLIKSEFVVIDLCSDILLLKVF